MFDKLLMSQVKWGGEEIINHLHIMSDIKNCKNKKDSESGTRTPVACVRGKHANHLHQFGFSCRFSKLSKIIIITSILLTTQSNILHKLNYSNIIHIN